MENVTNLPQKLNDIVEKTNEFVKNVHLDEVLGFQSSSKYELENVTSASNMETFIQTTENEGTQWTTFSTDVLSAVNKTLAVTENITAGGEKAVFTTEASYAIPAADQILGEPEVIATDWTTLAADVMYKIKDALYDPDSFSTTQSFGSVQNFTDMDSTLQENVTHSTSNATDPGDRNGPAPFLMPQFFLAISIGFTVITLAAYVAVIMCFYNRFQEDSPKQPTRKRTRANKRVSERVELVRTSGATITPTTNKVTASTSQMGTTFTTCPVVHVQHKFRGRREGPQTTNMKGYVPVPTNSRSAEEKLDSIIEIPFMDEDE